MKESQMEYTEYRAKTDRAYIGETGKPLGTRIKEHRKKWRASWKRSPEQRRPEPRVFTTNQQLRTMCPVRII